MFSNTRLEGGGIFGEFGNAENQPHFLQLGGVVTLRMHEKIFFATICKISFIPAGGVLVIPGICRTVIPCCLWCPDQSRSRGRSGLTLWSCHISEGTGAAGLGGDCLVRTTSTDGPQQAGDYQQQEIMAIMGTHWDLITGEGCPEKSIVSLTVWCQSPPASRAQPKQRFLQQIKFANEYIDKVILGIRLCITSIIHNMTIKGRIKIIPHRKSWTEQ